MYSLGRTGGKNVSGAAGGVSGCVPGVVLGGAPPVPVPVPVPPPVPVPCLAQSWSPNHRAVAQTPKSASALALKSSWFGEKYSLIWSLKYWHCSAVKAETSA